MRKRFSDGKVAMPYKRFLGYDKGEDGNPVINPEQAELVRRIYRMCVDGMTPTGIARQLTAEGIPTPGKKKVWQATVVESILTNEKYKGDALLQKKFTVDFLTKEQKVNVGEVPQYYVEDSHPPIIGEELFDYVQHELLRRKGLRFTSSFGCFASKIFCGECGSVYGVKVWHSNSKYRRVIWRCNKKYEKDGKPCCTPHFYEEQLKSMFVDMMNSRFSGRKEIICAYEEVIRALTDNVALKAELDSLQSECDVVLELMRQMVRENARAAGEQEEYRRRYGALMERYDAAKARLDEVTRAIERRNAKRVALEGFVKALGKRDALLSEFGEELWNAVVEKVIVRSAKEVIFILRDGSEIEWKGG